MGLRCFIAIEIPEQLRMLIRELIESLRQSGADVKWVGPESVHITLKFLGDTEAALIPDIRETLAKKLSHYNPFCIRITGVGSFPPGKYPRVIWVGIEETGVLTALQQDTEQALSALGFPAENRPFRAHLTVGRVKSSRRLADLVMRIRESEGASFGHFDVRGVRLMKSELKPAGPVYTCLAEIPLTGGADVGKRTE